MLSGLTPCTALMPVSVNRNQVAETNMHNAKKAGYLIVFRWEPRERIRSFIFSGVAGNFTLAQFVIGVQLGDNIVNAIFVWS